MATYNGEELDPTWESIEESRIPRVGELIYLPGGNNPHIYSGQDKNGLHMANRTWNFDGKSYIGWNYWSRKRALGPWEY